MLNDDTRNVGKILSDSDFRVTVAELTSKHVVVMECNAFVSEADIEKIREWWDKMTQANLLILAPGMRVALVGSG